MAEVEVGKVVHFFPRPSAAGIEITAGTLKIGDTIHIKGHTTDFEQVIESMQIQNQPITEAKVGDLVGIKVRERVRAGDTVYKVTEECA
ncbi:MAG TPA: translation elongation factor-like protein [Armatimonadetes bacterium]|nr:translation elongation factor-like protein [Armatimonadota bacterium]